MANDVFANIAANGIGGRHEFLCNPEPQKYNKKVCKLDTKDLTPYSITKKNVNKR